MLFSDALEVAIGLTFVFLLMSLVMTAVQEGLEAVLKRRGADLFEGVRELLRDPPPQASGPTAAPPSDRTVQAAKVLYEHPLIFGLYRGQFDAAKATRKLPSYIPARNFALAMIDQVLAGKLDPAVTEASLPAAASTTERLRLGAERIESEALRRAVLQAVETGRGDLERTRKNLEAWYDSAMDRVSGGYKRRAHALLFWLGLAVSVLLNVNALVIADSLSENAALRRAIASQAENYAVAAGAAAGAGGAEDARSSQPPASPVTTALTSDLPDRGPAAAGAAPSGEDDPATEPAAVAQPETPAWSVLEDLRQLGLPIGWGDESRRALAAPFGDGPSPWWVIAWLPVAAGWVMTALAITLGAPFWFDMLNKLMVVRSTVKPHEKSPEEASEDRRTDHGNAATYLTINALQPAKGAPAEPVSLQLDDDPWLIDPSLRLREDEDEADFARAVTDPSRAAQAASPPQAAGPQR